jgi:hypothetical protein
MGVGCATAGAGVLPRIAHHQFVHAGVEQIVQPGRPGPFFKGHRQSSAQACKELNIFSSFTRVLLSIGDGTITNLLQKGALNDAITTVEPHPRD